MLEVYLFVNLSIGSGKGGDRTLMGHLVIGL